MKPSPASSPRPSSWTSLQEVRPQESTGSLLRDLSRRRILDELLGRVLEHGALQGSDFASERRYVVLVVDKFTLRVLTAVCQIQHLLEEGVCLVEMIDCQRDALPTFDAIYFISPTATNLRQLKEDASGVGKTGKYNRFHVFFTHKLSDDLMKLVAASRDTVLQIGSFAEINLSFVTYDSRIFHFADESVFEEILREDTSYLPVSKIANRLATVLASLGVLQPKIRPQRNSGRTMNAAARLGLEVQLRLSEIESKATVFKHEQVPAGPHTLVIIERGYDWPALLAHDFHYEAAVYDLLGTRGDKGKVSIDDGVYRHLSNGVEKSYPLGDDKDSFWRMYHHMPCWDVIDDVVQEVEKWRAQDKEMRARNAQRSNMATMATSAMNALQSLPEHKERFARLEVHSDLVGKVKMLLDGHQLFDIGAFEQEMLTGVDFTGKDVMPRKIMEQLESWLNDPDLSPLVKQRLVMLFFACEEAGRHTDRIKAIAQAKLNEGERPIATGHTWLAKASMSVEANASKKRTFYKNKVRNVKNSRSSHEDFSAKLTQWQPKVRHIIEQTAVDGLSQELFPELGVHDVAAKNLMSTNPSPGLVIVYVIGGITLTEARHVHEASQSLGVEAFAGGDCILTASDLIEELGRHVADYGGTFR